MKSLMLAMCLPFLVGCLKKETAEVTVVWHASTSLGNRQLAKQSLKIKKGDNFAIFGSMDQLQGGQPVNFNGMDTMINVAFNWNDEGIFVVGAVGINDDWETARIQVWPTTKGFVRFESGILMKTTVVKHNDNNSR